MDSEFSLNKKPRIFGEFFSRIFGNPIRLKLLCALINYSESVTVYRMTKDLGITRDSIRRHIGILSEYNLVKIMSCGVADLYVINEENELIMAFREFVDNLSFLEANRLLTNSS